MFLDPSLDRWELDLDAGTVTLELAFIAPGSIDFSAINCPAFTIVSDT